MGERVSTPSPPRMATDVASPCLCVATGVMFSPPALPPGRIGTCTVIIAVVAGGAADIRTAVCLSCLRSPEQDVHVV